MIKEKDLFIHHVLQIIRNELISHLKDKTRLDDYATVEFNSKIYEGIRQNYSEIVQEAKCMKMNVQYAVFTGYLIVKKI